jgi:hypothetical protein
MSRTRHVVFVDHSYHRVTRSSRFFTDVLEEAADVTQLHADTWRGGARVTAHDIDALHADAVVFWQSLPYLAELVKLRTPAIWAPMYDSAIHRPSVHWRLLARTGLRILSFCRTLSGLARGYGIPVLDVTYFPDPAASATVHGDDGPVRIFLWDRGDIGFHHLKGLVDSRDVRCTMLRSAPDPGLRASRLTVGDREAYKVREISGPLSRERHLELLSTCDVFLAPRRLEGIGLSFLEAMALGLAVVAPDRPTMNEYIEHRVNGYLYDPRVPARLDLRDVRSVGARARRCVEDGHRAWSAASDALIAYIFAEDAPMPSPPGHVAAGARILTAGERLTSLTSPGEKAAIARLLRFRAKGWG